MEYTSTFDAACCGGPTLHRWTPWPAMEECVVCGERRIRWPDEAVPCKAAKQCADFEEYESQVEG